MNIDNLVAECGTTVIPGTTAKLYLACSCDVDVFPGFLATTGVGDSITLDGDITLAVGAMFAEIDIIVDTGEITHTMVGTRNSKNYTNKLDFKVIKNIASDEWFNKHPNACIVGIVKQKDGSMRVFGTKDIPATIDAAEGKSGSSNDTEAAWTASIMDSTGKVAPYYTGVIDLTA